MSVGDAALLALWFLGPKWAQQRVVRIWLSSTTPLPPPTTTYFGEKRRNSTPR